MRTSTRLSVLPTLLGVLVPATPARAQETTRMPEATRQSVGLDVGLENAIVARVTYAHAVDLGVLRDTRLYARPTLPFVTGDLGDWGVDGGLRATVLASGDWRLALLAGPVVRSNSNRLFSALAVGAGATMLVGYEGPRWGLSAEAGYEQFFTTHIRHSDAYREVGYADAKDGWYALSGSTAHAGLRGGARVGAVEVLARAGLDSTGQLHSLTPPFYFTLGSSYAF